LLCSELLLLATTEKWVLVYQMTFFYSFFYTSKFCSDILALEIDGAVKTRTRKGRGQLQIPLFSLSDTIRRSFGRWVMVL